MDPNGAAVPSVTPHADVVEELLKDELLTAALLLLLLLWNVRPRLHGSGFATYAAMTEPELAQHIADAAVDRQQWHCQRLLVVARLGRKKFMLLSTATSLIFAALLCSAFAAIAAAV